ncbi:MAG: hypothetical protein P4L35_09200 [Ignavibacteriaceae bacterium]|nr:hypothetical protein [Ignavibacteriaceae bacterium]
MDKLSERIVQKLSNPTSFELGKKYYLQGRVTEYTEDDNFIDATVIGTELYKIRIIKTDLSAECECKEYKGDELCKHLVAVLLTATRGILIPRQKPLLKEKEPDPNLIRDQQFKSSLEKIPRETLISDVAELGKRIPDIEEFFIHKYSEKTVDYYGQIELQIKKKINSILDYRGKKDFDGKVFTASREVNSLLQNLPVTRHTADFLLRTGYWISEKIADIDDSSGYLRELTYQILEYSCEYLNNARTDDLILFYKYCSLNTAFHFNIDIIKTILNKVTNLEILEALITKLEKSVYKNDTDFGFKPELGWDLLMNYLKHYKPAKYEELIPELINKSLNIKYGYINYLFEKGNYEEVIKFGFDYQTNGEIENAFEKSILALNNKKQIIEYYIRRLKEHFDLNTFKHFSEIEGIKELSEWRTAVDNILLESKYIYFHADILLYLKRYDEFIEFISSEGEDRYRNNSVIERHAVRFSITDPPIAIRLYRYLIEKEVVRLKKSNRYIAFREYYENLKSLNDIAYLEELKSKLIRENPTKLKLIEVLDEI